MCCVLRVAVVQARDRPPPPRSSPPGTLISVDHLCPLPQDSLHFLSAAGGHWWLHGLALPIHPCSGDGAECGIMPPTDRLRFRMHFMVSCYLRFPFHSLRFLSICGFLCMLQFFRCFWLLVHFAGLRMRFAVFSLILRFSHAFFFFGFLMHFTVSHAFYGSHTIHGFSCFFMVSCRTGSGEFTVRMCKHRVQGIIQAGGLAGHLLVACPLVIFCEGPLGGM